MTAGRNFVAKRFLFPRCLVAIWYLALIEPATAVPVYNIVRLGFDDLEHTHNSGYTANGPTSFNEAGQVIGYAFRYNGGSTQLGHSAWFYDGATTTNIGLTGAEHTRNDGYKNTPFISESNLNEAGQVTGDSYRYNGSTDLGKSAWFYDGATTIDIGLSGSEYTRTDGYKYSYVHELSEAGQVTGTSLRYIGGTDRGTSVWLYNGTATIDIGLLRSDLIGNDGYKHSQVVDMNEAGQVIGWSNQYNDIDNEVGRAVWLYGLHDGWPTIDIGLTDTEHTYISGYKYSDAFRMNEAGQVVGVSNHYHGTINNLGQSAWLFNGAATINIGLTGVEHTLSYGRKYSTVVQMNEAGQVVGHSERYYFQAVNHGQSAWLYNGLTTVEIGLTDNEHTGFPSGNFGYRSSSASNLNQAGQAIGTSGRFNGGNTFLGQTAWFYDGAIPWTIATTIAIGLTGAEHTRNDGYKYSYAGSLTEAGQVVGSSIRYNGGSTELGTSTWLYDGESTIEIGLTGAEYTRNDGYIYNAVERVNAAGQVIGWCQRYNGGSTLLGRTEWFYDPVLNQTFPLNLSTRSDGYAFSIGRYLGEDGIVLGSYKLDWDDNDLVDRAFYFTIADGLHDLGSLVDGGLAANGWDYLEGAIGVNGMGQIFGYGNPYSGVMSFVLTPTVAGLPGDFNHDGTVDATDYVVWRKTRSYSPDDYNAWKTNFGRTLFAGSGASAPIFDKAPSPVVPEPAPAISLLAGLCFAFAARRRVATARATR